jgi:hypothetical protein
MLPTHPGVTTGIPFETRFAGRKSSECRGRMFVELRNRAPLNSENDVTVYIVVEDFGDPGRSFRETDLAEADLGTIVHNMIWDFH